MSDYTIGIDMACNDPDNGLFAGRVAQIQVHAPDLLSLTADRTAHGLVGHHDRLLP